MDLQIALDRIPLARAVDLARVVAPHVDWVEVGTSLIKQFGEDGLRAVVAAAGPTPVLADLKTVDDATFELNLAFDCGAESATVLGMAPDVTIETAVQVATSRDRELVVDLMALPAARVAILAKELPRTVVLAPHVSKDAQLTGGSPVEMLGSWAVGRRLALAGGLTAEDLPALRTIPDLRVIIGSAVTKAADPLTAVLELRRAAGKESGTDER